MAEIRTHDTEDGSDLGRLVREALGETIRPVMPGAAAPPAVSQDEVGDADSASFADLPDLLQLSIDISDFKP